MDINIAEQARPDISGRICFHETIPSSVEEKDRVVDTLMTRMEDIGVLDDPGDQFWYRLCFGEAIQNAIQHGNRAERRKRVEVVLFEAANEWGIVVTDEGEGFRASDIPENASPESRLRETGRGIWIMHNCMDHLDYFDGGRTALLAMKKQAAQHSPCEHPVKNFQQVADRGSRLNSERLVSSRCDR